MFLIDSSHDLAMPNLDLIADKIAPPSQIPRLSRPRLLSMIEKSMVAGTSTIVSGRAGTGKTALALDFAGKCGRPAAWYKIDAPDADPLVFFNYLVRSIQKVRPGFAVRSSFSFRQPIDILRMTWLADSLVYELAECETCGPLLIVIEDLHLLSDSDWLVPFFSRLLPLLPSDVHMLITSRSLPTAPLWRMRSKQSLVLIDEAALAFTRSEANQLFESYGLSGDQAGIALDHTHGRAASLDESAAFLQQSVAMASDERIQSKNGNGGEHHNLTQTR